MAFTLSPLPYPADALEAAIDKTTMEIHHGRHHKTYVDNLNAALQGHANLESKSIEQLMREISSVPQDIRQKVINNGGGHANHTMFWEIMGPRAGPCGSATTSPPCAPRSALRTWGPGRPRCGATANCSPCPRRPSR